jgi:K(+)-stimulated pyrophosphate-energized sodium pump
MDINYLAVSLGAAGLALVFAIVVFMKIMKADPGDAKMQDIAKLVQEGARAFLFAEYKWLALFVAVVAAAIWFAPAEGLGSHTAIAFISGAVASASAGYFGMYTSTRAAVRTTQAARTSLSEALKVAFSSGSVMGMTVVGLALAGLVIFTYLYNGEGKTFTQAGINSVLGFSFGASSIALFARVGGGIFTKAMRRNTPPFMPCASASSACIRDWSCKSSVASLRIDSNRVSASSRVRSATS